MNFIKNLPAKAKFEYLKRRYYASLTPIPPDSDKIRSIVKELNEKGIVIIQDWMNPTTAEAILQEVATPLRNVQLNQNIQSYSHWRFPEYGVYRLLEADLHSPTAKREFFDSSFIKHIAQCYVSENVQPYQKMAEIKPDPSKESIADKVHFDDWKIRFKAFLYLSDVDENSAPFCYFPYSHRNKKIRAKKEFEYYKEGKKGNYGYYTLEEVKAIVSSSHLNLMSCGGKAGTLILVDTRGLHSGTPLINIENPRILLATYFDI